MARFSDLPTELRLMIWEYSLYAPTRKPAIVTTSPRIYRLPYYHATRPLPTVFHICTESRKAAFEISRKSRMRPNLLSPQFVFHTRDHAFEGPFITRFQSQNHRSTRVWFDFQYDTLYFHRLNYVHLHKKPDMHMIKNWEQKRIHNLALDLTDLRLILTGPLRLYEWTSLRNLTIVLPDAFDKPLQEEFSRLIEWSKCPQIAMRPNASGTPFTSVAQVGDFFQSYDKARLVQLIEDHDEEVQSLSYRVFCFVLATTSWRIRFRDLKRVWMEPEIEWCNRNELQAKNQLQILGEDAQLAMDIEMLSI